MGKYKTKYKINIYKERGMSICLFLVILKKIINKFNIGSTSGDSIVEQWLR